MRKLDWYILKKLLVTFFFCLFLFTIVAVGVDSSEKADDFVRTKLGTSQIIGQYYLGFVPWIWGLLFPLFVFIAVIFFTSKMAARSEIIAILASGTSFNRFLRPYMIGGLFLSLLLWMGTRYFIPKAINIKNQFQANYIDKNDAGKERSVLGCDMCFYRRLASDTYLGIKYFDTTTKAATLLFLEKVKNGKVVYNLRSGPAQWDTATAKWRLLNVVERWVDSIGERIVHKDTLMLSISVKPPELKRDEYLKDRLTTPELTSFIHREELRGTEGLSALKVEKHRRSATPFSVFLLTIIGVSIASRKTRGGSGVHLALGIVIAALYIVSDRFSTVFATNGNLSPILAAWLPNLAFSIVAYRLYKLAPK